MTNPDNVFICTGRVPASDKFPYDYRVSGNGENGGIFQGFISVRRSYKKKDEQYYPEDLIMFKAFGSTAKYLNDYTHRGDYLRIVGQIQKEDDWVDEKSGEKRSGRFFIYVDSVHKQMTGGESSETGRMPSEGKRTQETFVNPLQAARRSRVVA